MGLLLTLKSELDSIESGRKYGMLFARFLYLKRYMVTVGSEKKGSTVRIRRNSHYCI